MFFIFVSFLRIGMLAIQPEDRPSIETLLELRPIQERIAHMRLSIKYVNMIRDLVLGPFGTLKDSIRPLSLCIMH